MAKPNRMPEEFESILIEIQEGSSVKKACDKRKMAQHTFYDYIDSDEELRKKYTLARERRGETAIERLEEELDLLKMGAREPAASRVIIDTYKWLACKFYPKMYGDKQEITHTGSVNLMPTVKINGKDLDIKVGEDV